MLRLATYDLMAAGPINLRGVWGTQPGYEQGRDLAEQLTEFWR